MFVQLFLFSHIVLEKLFLQETHFNFQLLLQVIFSHVQKILVLFFSLSLSLSLQMSSCFVFSFLISRWMKLISWVSLLWAHTPNLLLHGTWGTGKYPVQVILTFYSPKMLHFDKISTPKINYLMCAKNAILFHTVSSLLLY